MMKRLAFLGFLLAGPALAQSPAQPGCTLTNPPCQQPSIYVPTGETTLTAGVVSSRVPFPTSGQTTVLKVRNDGTVTAYIVLGGSTVVADLTKTPLDPGVTIALPQGTSSNLAAITASGTASLNVQSGNGVPIIIQGQVSLTPGSVSPTVTVTQTDRSGAITLGGLAQTQMAANPTRHGCTGQNQSTGDLWIDWLSTARQSQPSEWLPPGAYYTCSSTGVPSGALSVIGPVTGQAFSFKEW